MATDTHTLKQVAAGRLEFGSAQRDAIYAEAADELCTLRSLCRRAVNANHNAMRALKAGGTYAGRNVWGWEMEEDRVVQEMAKALGINDTEAA